VASNGNVAQNDRLLAEVRSRRYRALEQPTCTTANFVADIELTSRRHLMPM
jgi:hypothetical protein